MLQMALFLVFVLLIAFGFSWLSDQPGTILINFAGYERLFTPVEFVIALMVLFGGLFAVWIILQRIINIPELVATFFKRRRDKRGLEALSAGLIAVGIGDRAASSRYASQARRSLPNEPLTALLRAQNAQLVGDRKTARRIYEAMLSSPDTELLGLRGLFLEAQMEKEDEAAAQFAEQAVALNPGLQWSVVALFQFQCKKEDWAGALKTLETARQYKHINKLIANRHRAILLTAQAVELEESDMDKALELSLEAHKIATDLIPAADIAGRILASKGNTGKAAKVVARTWKLAPHPDLALTYSYARTGDSTRDRLERTRTLASMNPNSTEGPIAVALAAIEAKDWESARTALKNLIKNKPSARVCTLMARVEGEQGDQGRMREWLARAVHAPRDPVWTADGYISDRWKPISPVTGALDCFEWKVPVESVNGQAEQASIDGVLPPDVLTSFDKTPHKTSRQKQETEEPAIEQESGEQATKDKEDEVVPEDKQNNQEQRQSAAPFAPSWTHGKLTEYETSEPHSIQQSINYQDTSKEALQQNERKSGKELIVREEEETSISPAFKEKEQARPETEEKATTLRPKYAQRPAMQPDIYVSPRAPDDPGVVPESDK